MSESRATGATAWSVLFVVIGLAFPQRLLAQDPVDDAVEKSIARALEFIASQQTDHGSWRTESWGDSSAITSLAVMSYLAAGHVPGEGIYGERINRGVRWVVGQQQPDGMLISKKSSHGPMYNHGICALMLGEVAGMMDGADAMVVRRSLEDAIRLILESQALSKNNRHQGGWRYQTNSRDSDLSVTGWQVMALRAAKDIGCDVPAEAIDAAVQYVKNCSARKNEGFSYQPGNAPTSTLTGIGITCLEVCGAHQTPEAIGGAKWLIEHPLHERSSYFYYGVYYTGVGMFKMGGNIAKENHKHLAGLLLPLQDDDGGWTPIHGSERQAGRIYATAAAVLALTVEYRYLPIYQR
ncbi:prenyltransferase/squalene oxidase repeat-containing protein [Thalassoglobus sp.]|uniref:prenyltransferase/squalene oxidase repeat-containing protein n=1 Tax=Thalassoglobus sp. TaxID=2795869 RepID=UPI003AA81F00